jgi:hypothetical protein
MWSDPLALLDLRMKLVVLERRQRDHDRTARRIERTVRRAVLS